MITSNSIVETEGIVGALDAEMKDIVSLKNSNASNGSSHLSISTLGKVAVDSLVASCSLGSSTSSELILLSLGLAFSFKHPRARVTGNMTESFSSIFSCVARSGA